MTADIRTAAEREADGYGGVPRRTFIEGYVLGATRGTPTREQIAETLNSHDLDRRYGAPGTDWRCICNAEFGKFDGWKEHRAAAVLALLAGLAEGESGAGSNSI